MAAAIRVIVRQGLSAPTAVIAKEAGVANGSLFTYFPTKVDLFNRLYVDLKQEVAAASLHGVPASGRVRDQFATMWSNWMHWALAEPDKRRTLALLGVSDDITDETRAVAHREMAPIAALVEQARSGGPMGEAPFGLVVSLMNAMADATMDFMAKDPANADAHCVVGFDAMWRMLGH
ncbi:TetR/AcrR family transcriptional regulator [Burkholderia stagnalis]